MSKFSYHSAESEELGKPRPPPPAPTLGKRAVWRGLCCASSSALLSLPVVGCFECFGFPVKCAKASCFLLVVFYGFSTCGCYLAHEFYYFECPKPIHLTGLVPPSSHPDDHFVSLRTPERTMEGHMGAQNQILSDFG